MNALHSMCTLNDYALIVTVLRKQNVHPCIIPRRDIGNLALSQVDFLRCRNQQFLPVAVRLGTVVEFLFTIFSRPKSACANRLP